ncbi:hypothetical protein [Sphingomonas sp.]|uniref:hypothetical protein n=1 Tax=Sphingomonas sp. TaxID=28214 RepID=UPI001B091A72|nr:hypothetical protein [Sphingomonas sp.]MBO9714154.1 hypothetical protein [Sphingomonas sp.]
MGLCSDIGEARTAAAAEGVDALYARLEGKAELVDSPYDAFHGRRELILRDLSGFWIPFAEPVKERADG